MSDMMKGKGYDELEYTNRQTRLKEKTGSATGCNTDTMQTHRQRKNRRQEKSIIKFAAQ